MSVDSTEQKVGPGAPRLNQNAAKHHAYSPVGKVSRRGKRKMDGRTTEFKIMKARREAYYSDRGGKAQYSAKELAIIEDLVVDQCIQDRIKDHVIQKPSVMFTNKGRSLTPVVRDRRELSDSIMRKLQALGLERVAPKTQDLAEYLKSKSQEKAQ